MDYYQHPKKTKLDFMRPTFDEREFKVPNIQEQSHENERSRKRSEKASFADDEESSRDSDVSSASALISSEKVAVYLRLKPTPTEVFSDLYYFDERNNNVTLKGTQTTSQLTERQFTFSHILNQETDQKTVYERCVRPILVEPFVTNGGVICSYGVSNSGKTYTILGEKSAGVVPRALTQIFTENEALIAAYPCVKVQNDRISILEDSHVEAELETSKEFIRESRKMYKGKRLENWMEDIKSDHQFETKELSKASEKIYVWVSFAEIYNESINDLFSLSKAAPASIKHSLKIISNAGNSYILGLTWLFVSSLKDAIELLQQGLNRVKYASTGLNPHSSRSHTIFTINMVYESDSNYDFSSYKFCDLAGAERASKTGNAGDRLKETGGINKSLLVLGRCLEAVQYNQKPEVKKKAVPVRESKLTFLLQRSLMGEEKFVMIVNLLPNSECYDENINVLHFGSIANKITILKNEVRKFPRFSSRYTYFMQEAINSPKMHSSLVFDGSL